MILKVPFSATCALSEDLVRSVRLGIERKSRLRISSSVISRMLESAMASLPSFTMERHELHQFPVVVKKKDKKEAAGGDSDSSAVFRETKHVGDRAAERVFELSYAEVIEKGKATPGHHHGDGGSSTLYEWKGHTVVTRRDEKTGEVSLITCWRTVQVAINLYVSEETGSQLREMLPEVNTSLRAYSPCIIHTLLLGGQDFSKYSDRDSGKWASDLIPDEAAAFMLGRSGSTACGLHADWETGFVQPNLEEVLHGLDNADPASLSFASFHEVTVYRETPIPMIHIGMVLPSDLALSLNEKDWMIDCRPPTIERPPATKAPPPQQHSASSVAGAGVVDGQEATSSNAASAASVVVTTTVATAGAKDVLLSTTLYGKVTLVTTEAVTIFRGADNTTYYVPIGLCDGAMKEGDLAAVTLRGKDVTSAKKR